MKTYTLLTGITLALAPGAALATASGDEDCAAACASNETAANCCLAETVAVSEAPVALASAAVACERGMLGVYLADTDGPAVVEGLVEGGPAAKAGLKAGDRILAVGDNKVKNWNQLTEWMASRQAGERLSVTVERDGWKKVVEITLAPAPAPPAGAGSNAATAPSSGFFFDAETGPMTLELLGDHDEHEHEHDHDGDDDDHDDDGEHGGHAQVFTLKQGDGHAMVFGGEGGQWVTTLDSGDGHVIDLTDVTHGVHDFTFADGQGQAKGQAKVKIKAIKDGQMIELEDLDIDLSDLHMDLSRLHEGLDLEELHESLGALKGLHVNVTKEIGSEACCEGCDGECCEVEAQANVFHVLGDGDMGHLIQPGQSGAKGVIVHRMGGASGKAPHTLQWVDGSGEVRVHVSGEDGHNTFEWSTEDVHENVPFGVAGDGEHELHFFGGPAPHGEHEQGGDLRRQILLERGGDVPAPQVLRGRLLARPDAAPGQRVRVGRQLAAPGAPRRNANADLDELRQELQALRDELRQLRQSLRRIQAGQRN